MDFPTVKQIEADIQIQEFKRELLDKLLYEAIDELTTRQDILLGKEDHYGQDNEIYRLIKKLKYLRAIY